MPTESKSETPRTLAALGTPHQLTRLIEESTKLEKELNEANARLVSLRHDLFHAHDNCLKQNDFEQLKQERNALAKENKVKDDALKKLHDFLSGQPQLCFGEGNDGHHMNWPIRDEIMDKICHAIGPVSTINLIVLTRAEVEELPCGCNKLTSGHRSGKIVGDKCHRCLLLERLTK